MQVLFSLMSSNFFTTFSFRVIGPHVYGSTTVSYDVCMWKKSTANSYYQLYSIARFERTYTGQMKWHAVIFTTRCSQVCTMVNSKATCGSLGPQSWLPMVTFSINCTNHITVTSTSVKVPQYRQFSRTENENEVVSEKLENVKKGISEKETAQWTVSKELEGNWTGRPISSRVLYELCYRGQINVHLMTWTRIEIAPVVASRAFLSETRSPFWIMLMHVYFIFFSSMFNEYAGSE